MYVKEKDKLKQIMSRIPNRVCLTSDVWTTINSEGYICLTAHFVDDNWRLISKILNFCRMKPPHTRVELETTLFDCLKEWGLKVAAEALYKIRESVKYVKVSDGRMIKFQDCVEQAGIDTSIGLRTDVSTRWSSTYLMLESALKYEKAFEILQVLDRNYKHCSSYPTSNLYFMQVWKIECLLDEILEAVRYVREKIDELYEEYASNLQGSSSSHSLSSNKSSILHKSSGEGSRSKKSKLYIKEFEMFESESMYAAGKTELDLYLDEPKVKFGQGEDFDVLNYWKLNESRFPTLSIMARDVLSIPIATVASESAFRIGGHVPTKYRSSTLPENLQILICTRNWLHGFALNHNGNALR
ncbi:zinc finger BED domain-containing protein RICESLEEPER 2-like [Gastrolobium bilobum]|uniref:zinc finger BED domain-containing protein RICESLEEPER 2-like n=1 Tax=Gastrolobium bilobum TaxID=150636 RepID=UPI002AAF9086|nr:zinc finger BED domain-containing protein RICESLEEPER 2-like [Gastrolobium bilobum]